MSVRGRLATAAILIQGLMLMSSPTVAVAEGGGGPTQCSEPTGWCCIQYPNCSSGVYCCYFVDNVMIQGSCYCV